MKKLIIALSLLILALPLSAQAHTTLTTSTPAEGEVMKEELKEVQLTFGTVIEQGSTMTLQGEEMEFKFENVTVSENIMTGILGEELPNGAYTVQWKIIGADGHPIDGEIPFAVDVETAEEPVTKNEGTANEEPAVGEEGTADEEPVTEEQSAPSEAAAVEEKNNLIVTVLMVAAALLLVAGMFRLFKKKQ